MITDYRVGLPQGRFVEGAADDDADATDLPPQEGRGHVPDGPADPVEVRAEVVGAAFHGQRLDRMLVEMAPEFSRNHLQTLIAAGHVRADGRAATTASRRLRAGQRIELELMPTAESRAFRPEPLPLQIVHEDESLLVVDKPAGMVVHPAAGNWSGTLLNALLAHHRDAASLPRAGIVHRLDKDTSGLMVVGKTLVAVTALSRAIAAREVHRQYLAIAQGSFPRSGMRIDAPIARDPRSRVRMAIVTGGRASRTDVELIATDGLASALRCTLHTGRTHQIRVHLSSRGHPLIADSLYGGPVLWGLQRQALHAARLVLRHPADGSERSFESALPSDMRPAWDALLASAAATPAGKS